MQKKSETSKECDETYYILYNCGDCINVCILSESEKRNRYPSEMAGNRWKNGNLKERENQPCIKKDSKFDAGWNYTGFRRKHNSLSDG